MLFVSFYTLIDMFFLVVVVGDSFVVGVFLVLVLVQVLVVLIFF